MGKKSDENSGIRISSELEKFENDCYLHVKKREEEEKQREEEEKQKHGREMRKYMELVKRRKRNFTDASW